ncbi:hypothetical protein AC578_3190 [Pseudocercospora eumusae]|uniref:Uncharacterized protein n=1 Tax=Pseudocercospora eumusae TaxID=321146 RepID=A0A139H5J2_9PEZI|nr:hypothetical protein AC578_3190 [Pseudocercospora eumusae]
METMAASNSCTAETMGNAGSKLCETEKFEQHQQGFARASEAFSQKRPRSPGSDLIENGPPQPKRNRRSDDQIEEIRKDLERRFEALRSQAGTQTARSVDSSKRAFETDASGIELDLGEQPSPCATFGHSEVADGPAEQSSNSTSWVADSRSPSPELLAGPLDEVIAYGWSTREINADLAELSKILLLTNDWPDYAAALRKSTQQENGDTFTTHEQLKRSTLGIKLAHSALSRIDLEPDTAGSASPESHTLAHRALNLDNAHLQLPNSSRVDNAFDELDAARAPANKFKLESFAAFKHLISSSGQRPLAGLWQRNGSQSPPCPTPDQNWSLNDKNSWKKAFEPLRSQRQQQRH